MGWRWPQLSYFTNGELWDFDGIAGANKEPGTWIWAAFYYKDSTPSLTSSQIARPADQVMIAQANHHDFNWAHGCTPDNWFRFWGDPPFNLYGDSNMTCGPASRVGANGVEAGIIPVSTDRSTITTLPSGRNISVMTDGHAKTRQWKAMMSKRSVRGGLITLDHFWPNE